MIRPHDIIHVQIVLLYTTPHDIMHVQTVLSWPTPHDIMHVWVVMQRGILLIFTISVIRTTRMQHKILSSLFKQFMCITDADLYELSNFPPLSFTIISLWPFKSEIDIFTPAEIKGGCVPEYLCVWFKFEKIAPIGVPGTSIRGVPTLTGEE